MTNVIFDNCSGCGLQKSLLKRGQLHMCMRCIAQADDPDLGDFRAQEAREMELQSRP